MPQNNILGTPRAVSMHMAGCWDELKNLVFRLFGSLPKGPPTAEGPMARSGSRQASQGYYKPQTVALMVFCNVSLRLVDFGDELKKSKNSRFWQPKI